MNSNEFYEFWKHATAAFPAVHRLFDNSAAAKERSKIWQAALAKVSLVHANEAVDAMVRGEAEVPRFEWSEFPKFVYRYCVDAGNAEMLQERRSYYGESPAGSVRCLLCGDSQSGLVAIWNPAFIEALDVEIIAAHSICEVVQLFQVWRGKNRQSRRYMTFAVICCCESPIAKGKRDAGARRVLDAKRHAVVSSLPNLQAHLQDSSRLVMDF